MKSVGSKKYTNHSKFVSVKNVLRETQKSMKEKLKNPENAVVYSIKNNGNVFHLF